MNYTLIRVTVLTVTLFFSMEIKFEKAVYKATEIPVRDLPVVVLCGRSNVGKSSFINSLFNKKNIAKTSSTPGKTRSINYYLINNKFYLVDLPGFGYAKVSKKERDEWQKLIEQYIAQNKNIVMAFHFVDSRHEPTPLDILLNRFLNENDITFTVILNKIDKLKQSEIAAAKNNVVQSFPELIYGDNLLMYSSISGFGIKEIAKRLNVLFLH